MAKVWVTWHGGPSYSVPEIPRDVETFASLADAKDMHWRRQDGDPYYPCVTESETWVYFYDPTGDDVRDPYPDRIITMGPRGGVRVERC